MGFRSSMLAAAFLVAAFSPAMAQNAAPAPAPLPGTPVTFRGTIDTVTGDVLALTTREGPKVSVTLLPELTVSYHTQQTLADLDPGANIGVTTVDGPDGMPRALEVHVMDGPTNVRRPWDLAPNATMTNGVVTAAADQGAGAGRLITVHYKTADQEGDWTVLVSPETPVTAMMRNGDRSLLVPGAYVYVSARRLDDGSHITRSIQAERDGVKPPL